MKTHHVPRPDAVDWNGRDYVPTINGQPSGNTVWIANVKEFRAAGGQTHLNADQTEITLTLPAGHKFDCKFDPVAAHVAAIEKAESFIAGFEGDEMQAGVDNLLNELRALISPRPDWEEIARREGWQIVQADPRPDYSHLGPCLYHADLERARPLDDWKGAAMDSGVNADGIAD